MEIYIVPLSEPGTVSFGIPLARVCCQNITFLRLNQLIMSL